MKPASLNKIKVVKKMGLQDVATDIKALGPDISAFYAEKAVSIETLSKDIKEMIKTFQKEHAERKAEFKKMMECFTENLHQEVQQFMKDIDSENVKRRAEASYLLAGFKEEMRKEVNKLQKCFRKEHQRRQNEVCRLMAALKEMWSAMTGAKGNTKKVSSGSLAERKEKKPIRKAKGKLKKTQIIMKS